MDSNYSVVKKLPSIDDVVAECPLSESAATKVDKDRREVYDIVAGRDKRLLLIVGPCSAWPKEAVVEYAKRLKVLADEVEKTIKIVMRVYINKPRTIKGWLGPANQPDPFAPPDIARGLAHAREMMAAVVELGVPIADEAVFIRDTRATIDLLSWMAIGARSVEDQEHRMFVSGSLPAVGMKNGTMGDLEVAVRGIVAAQHAHHMAWGEVQVETKGNPYTHLVLRGGEGVSNYDLEHILEADRLFKQYNVKNPALIVDASHDNCMVDGVKTPAQQARVVEEVLALWEADDVAHGLVKGFMMESFLKEGSQNLEALSAGTIDRGGLSITDPCLGWESTESIVREIASATA